MQGRRPRYNENYRSYSESNINNNSVNSPITLLRARSGSQPSENVLSSLRSENRGSIEGNIPPLYNRNAGINLLNELQNRNANEDYLEIVPLVAAPLVSAAAATAKSRRRSSSLNSKRSVSSHGTAKVKPRKRKTRKIHKYRVAIPKLKLPTKLKHTNKQSVTKPKAKSPTKFKHSRKQKRLQKMNPNNLL
jgi:hypothetical protein